MNAHRSTGSRLLLVCSVLSLLVVSTGCQTPFRPPWAPGPNFEFALIGDTPYSAQDTTNAFPNLIEEINRARLAFVVHDGDIKAGATPCTDELFEERYHRFQTFRHPFIFVFGDNEWSDCLQPKDNPRDPMERLDKLRDLFTQGDHSLGRKKLKLSRQSETEEFSAFRENVRWTYGNVVFVGLNIPGTGNNFGHPEFAERNGANLAWLKDSFEIAAREKRSGVMIIIQANPRFELPPGNKIRAGFNEFIELLERETIAFGKPVVLVHGDSHYFRIDKPLMGTHSKRRVENFTRVETFGNPDVHWLKVTVDPSDPELFTFRQRIVTKNLVRHTRKTEPKTAK
jgi:hypothetical protein